MKDAEAQKIEARTAVHLSLDELESMDLPFNVALTPWQCQGGLGRFQISFEPGGEAGQCGVFGSCDPRDQRWQVPLTDDAEKVLR